MSWARISPDEVLSIEVEGLDVDAFGLFMWSSFRSWSDDGLPDNPDVIQRALRGRIDARRFEKAWQAARALMELDAKGRLRVPWVERARAEQEVFQSADAARKRASREKAKAAAASAMSAGRPRTSDTVPHGPSESTDGRTDGRTDEQPDGHADGASPTKPTPKLSTSPPSTPSSAHAELIDWWSRAFEIATGSRYAVEGAKDGKAAKDLLQRTDGDLAEIQRRGDAYFADPFHRKTTGFSLSRFLSAWNTLAKPAASTAAPSQGFARGWTGEEEHPPRRTVDVSGGRTT